MTDPITTDEELAALPVGTVVECCWLTREDTSRPFGEMTRPVTRLFMVTEHMLVAERYEVDKRGPYGALIRFPGGIRVMSRPEPIPATRPAPVVPEGEGSWWGSEDCHERECEDFGDPESGEKRLDPETDWPCSHVVWVPAHIEGWIRESEHNDRPAPVVSGDAEWVEDLPNDGEWEYTTSGACDGSNVQHHRRRPRYVRQHGSWEPTTRAAFDRALGLTVADEGRAGA